MPTVPERDVDAYADGASWGNPGPAGCGAYLATPGGRVIWEAYRGLGHATNNEAEYAGALLAVEMAAEHGATAVTLHMDSKLVVEQLTRSLGLGVGWTTGEPRFVPFQERIAALVERFDTFSLRWIPRAHNARADRLAYEAVATSQAAPPQRRTPMPAGVPQAMELTGAALWRYNGSVCPRCGGTVWPALASDVRWRPDLCQPECLGWRATDWEAPDLRVVDLPSTQRR